MMIKIEFLLISFIVAVLLPSNVQATSLQTKDYSEKMARLRAVQQLIIAKVQVCYHRYQLCVRKLSSRFCLTGSGEKAFYRWAQRMASRIMNGEQDDFSFDCSPQFTRSVVHGPLRLLVRRY